MKRRPWVLPIVVLMAGVLVGCRSPGLAEGPSGSATDERTNTDAGTIVSQDLGRVPLRDFEEALERVLIGRYRFSLRRRDVQFQSVYYETLAVLRAPTDVERAEGVLEARHRVIIEGRRTSGTQIDGGAALFRIQVRVENEVRTRYREDWRAGPTYGAEIEDEMRRMISDLQLEVRSGR